MIINIKNQICDLISNIKNGFATPQDDSGDFEFLSKKFLNANSYLEMERYGRLIMRNVFMIHGKSEDIGPVLENLNNFESYFDYDFRLKQKLHFWHLTNVFLLGLYLFHKVEKIKENIIRYIENDCPSVKLIVKENNSVLFTKNWRYSAKSQFGEFLYRWRLASLCHDIGTPLSQVGKDENKTRRMLRELRSVSTIRLTDINSLLTYESKFLNISLDEGNNNKIVYNPGSYYSYENSIPIFTHLDESIDSISLKRYVENQKINPCNQEIYYDHGIFGALLFIIIVNENFRLYDEERIYEFNKGIWHPYLFRKSLMHSAKAIAMHNLDQDDKSSFKSLINKDLQIYSFEKDPISWLLKISDTLQVWDKPNIEKIDKYEKIKPTLFRIDIEGSDNILLKNLDNGEIILEKIAKFTKGPINFRQE